MWLQLLTLAFLFLLILAGLSFLWETRGSRRPGRAVYVGSQLGPLGPLLKGVVERYLGKETSGYALVEPGAGLAYVAAYLGREFPWRTVEAVELGRTLALFSWLRTKLFDSGRPMRILCQDILAYRMPERSFVYCYLNDRLLGLMKEKGLFAGQLVVCLTFEIPDETALEVIDVPTWQGKLRVYDFRSATSTGTKP
jgi:hypothetical protein